MAPKALNVPANLERVGAAPALHKFKQEAVADLRLEDVVLFERASVTEHIAPAAVGAYKSVAGGEP